MENDEVRSHLKAALAAAVADSERRWQRQHEDVQSLESRRREYMRPLVDALTSLEREVNDKNLLHIYYHDGNQTIRLDLGGAHNVDSLSEYTNALLRGYHATAPKNCVVSVPTHMSGVVATFGSGENEYERSFETMNDVLEYVIKEISEFVAMRKVVPREREE